MLETSTAVQAVNIDGEFQRALPLSARRGWMYSLNLAPGVVSTEGTATSLQTFSVHGSDMGSHVLQIDGADMAAPSQNLPQYITLNPDVIQDVQIKTAAVDASARRMPRQGATSSRSEDPSGDPARSTSSIRNRARRDATNAASSAVLPTPALPLTHTSRAPSSSRRANSADSRSRPTSRMSPRFVAVQGHPDTVPLVTEFPADLGLPPRVHQRRGLPARPEYPRRAYWRLPRPERRATRRR